MLNIDRCSIERRKAATLCAPREPTSENPTHAPTNTTSSRLRNADNVGFSPENQIHNIARHLIRPRTKPRTATPWELHAQERLAPWQRKRAPRVHSGLRRSICAGSHRVQRRHHPYRRPQGIATGPDGNVWFPEQDGGRIGRITPLGVVTEFSSGIASGAAPGRITLGPDGNLIVRGD